MPQKLASKYYASYLVTEKIGKVAYRLQLPPKAKIHDVFHVSLLKRYEGNQHSICPKPPAFWEVKDKKPKVIMDRRVVKRGNHVEAQLMIKWKDVDLSETSWEDAATLRRKYPWFNLAA